MKLWRRGILCLSATLLALSLSVTLRGSEPFSQKAEFDNPGSESQSLFGMSVAMSENGSNVVLSYVNGITDLSQAVSAATVPTRGVAAVFVRPFRGWPSKPAPAAWLTSPAGPATGGFGVAVSTDGSTIAVFGAGGAKLSATTAWVYLRPLGGWTGQIGPAATLSVPNAVGDDVVAVFGTNLSMTPDGSVILVGRPGAKDVLVFTRPAHGWAGNLSAAATLAPPVGQADTNFGLSTAISADGSSAAVGIAETKSSPVPGRIYVYRRPDGGWSGEPASEATLLDPSNVSASDVTLSTAIDDAADTVIATFVSKGSGTLASATILVFERPDGAWIGETHPSARLTFPGAAPFRATISGDGTTVGSNWLTFDSSGPTGAGVLVFHRPSSGWSDSSMPDATLNFPVVSSTTTPFGFSIAGDRRGDRWIAGSLLEVNNNLQGSSVLLWELPPAPRSEVIPPALAIPGRDRPR